MWMRRPWPSTKACPGLWERRSAATCMRARTARSSPWRRDSALCDTCRDFPRLCHDYGDFQELQLELSCPEAARLLLTQAAAAPCVKELPLQGEPDYDREAMELLLATRDTARTLVSQTDPAEGLILLFFYGLSVQQQLDGEESEFSPESALETARQMAEIEKFSEISEFFAELDVLTVEWTQLLSQVTEPHLSPLTGNLAVYLLDRYWLQAVSDYDLYCRVKFILITCLLVGSLPGDFVWNAHLYSKEIENDFENLEAILDGAYSSPIFTDARLLGYLLEAENRFNC